MEQSLVPSQVCLCHAQLQECRYLVAEYVDACLKDQVKSIQIKENQNKTKWHQVKSNRIKLNQIKQNSNEIKIHQGKSNQIKLNQVKSN